MPYTIHTAKAKIRDGLGNFRNIDVFSGDVEDAKTTALAEVAAAQTAALNAIGDKANEGISQYTTNDEVEAMLAPIFDAATAYAAGTYVRNADGSTNKLYRLTADHAENTNWANTSKVEVKISSQVADLKSAIDYIPESILAIGGVCPLIFTPGCYDTPATGIAVAWHENNHRVTAYAPVSPGEIITVDATGGSGYQRLYVFIDEDGNAVGDRSPTNWSGKRTLTAPTGAVAVAINNDTAIQPTGYYAYIGDAITDSAFMSKGDVGSDVTALSGFTGIGHWFIAATRVTALTDKPDNMPARASILAVYPYDGGVWQYLWQKDTAYCWIRAINTSTQAVGSWTELRDSRNLTTVQNGDANNIVWNGYYGWGSSDSVSHVPNDVNAGTLVNINRDQNTKYQFAISYQDGHVYVRSKKLGTWYDWNQLIYTSDVLKPLIKYESGSFDSGKATERLLIYLPCNGHYICYYFYHYVVADINCNCWRIYNIYKVSADFSTSTLLTTSGEFECAVKLDGRSDFSGGSTHGDEIMTGWDLFVDGSRKTANLSSLDGRTEFTEIRFVRQSNLYDPNDSTTIIADHGCEYVFDGESGTMKINQSLKWRGAYALDNCFLAMFTPRKSVTDHGYTDVDFTPITLTSEIYTVDVPGAKKAVIYGENTDFCAEFAIERYPELASGNKFRFTDNNGLSYNKCYFFVASGGTSTAGELWQSTTVYKVEA